MRQLNLILVWQHHQPIGNLPDVMEDCYAQTYLPMLETLEKYPTVRVNLYYSGPLLEYLKKSHPGFIARLRDLVERGQVELLAGAFYEPVMSDLLPEDREGQIEKSIQWIQNEFGYTPRGIWLAEGVWDSKWIPAIRKSGIEYTILGSEFFYRGGLKQANLVGHYVTDSFGETLEVFPENPAVSRFSPTGSPDEFITCLKRLANRGDRNSILCTSSMDNWGFLRDAKVTTESATNLASLFQRLNANAEWISTLKVEEYRKQFLPNSWIALPAGIRAEMEGWSLPGNSRQDFQFTLQEVAHRHDVDRFKPYLQSGNWEGFRNRYHEANLMFRKTHYLRRNLDPNHPRYAELLDMLWSAQCNTAYWYGSYGGIYFTHLRQAVWEKLVNVEQIMREGQVGVRIEKNDLIGDARMEYHFNSQRAAFVFKPDYGGACIEWSLFRFDLNLCNAMTRRNEQIPQLNGNGKNGERVIEDWYQRYCFQDRFISKNLTATDLANNTYTEYGDFVNQPYTVVEEFFENNIARITMERNGGLYRQNNRQPVTVRKTFEVDVEQKTLTAKYVVRNDSPIPLDAIFAIEHNMLFGNHPDNPEQCLAGGQAASVKSFFEVSQVDLLEIESAGTDTAFQLKLANKMNLWMLPIKVLHQKQEWLYQGTSIVLGYPIDLKPQECYEQTISFSVTTKP